MDLSEIVSITGMPGLFKVSSRRNDGLIVTSLVDDKTQFVSGRTSLFSTLDNITIYTTDEPVLLKDVLASIKKHDDAALKLWLEKILPTYDKEKVHVSDMKKLAKWYSILNTKNLIEELIADKAEEELDENKDGKEESAEKKTAAKKETKPKAVKTETKSAKSTSRPAPIKKITTPRKAS